MYQVLGRIKYSRFQIRTQHLIDLLYHALLTRRMTHLCYVCEYKTHFGECHNLSGYYRLSSYLALNKMSVFSPVSGCYGTSFKSGDAQKSVATFSMHVTVNAFTNDCCCSS